MSDTIKATGPGRIRALNRKAVLDYIRIHGPTSRSGLIPALKLSAAGVSSVTNELLNSGLLQNAIPATDQGAALRGRPKSPLALNPDAAFAIGLRLQPVDEQCRIQIAWIDYAGQIRQLDTHIFDGFMYIDQVVNAILSVLVKVTQVIPQAVKISAATIAIPGVTAQNEVLLAPALKAIEGHSFAAAIAHKLDYPVSLYNDVNLAVLSELHAQTRLSRINFTYMYIGSGVGAGIGLNGKLWSANGWAGEVGHLRIAHGNTGNLSFEELLNTGHAFGEETERLGLSADDLDGLAEALSSGDKQVLKAVESYTQVLSELVLILCAVAGLDEAIIDFPSQRLFSHMQVMLEASIAQQPLKVIISTPANGDGAAVRGAAIAALDMVIDRINNAPAG
ncbi:MAG: ROK family protein [Gammaproteobacteria bacterium]|nr:ROK family protein [Gammaproteobacteria bacterium]